MDEAYLRDYIPEVMQEFDERYIPPKWSGYDELDRYESCSKCGALVLKHSIARYKHDEFHGNVALVEILIERALGLTAKILDK